MLNFARMLTRCKFKGEELLGVQRIDQACRQPGHCWRDGKLPPAVTVTGMMQQVAYANVSCAAVRQMHGGVFTAEAFCVRGNSEDFRALQIFAAVETTCEPEMAAQVGTSFCEQIHDRGSHYSRRITSE